MINSYQEPGGPGVRVDSAVYAGYSPNQLYDPLVAKLVVTSREHDFDTLRRRALRAINDEFLIDGIDTTKALLASILVDPAFVAGNITTTFLQDHPELASQAAAEKSDVLELLKQSSGGSPEQATRSPQKRDVPGGVSPGVVGKF